MSADNGFILRRNKDDKFVLQEYSASDESLPSIDAKHVVKCDTLESAIFAYEMIRDMPGMIVEHGLDVRIQEITE